VAGAVTGYVNGFNAIEGRATLRGVKTGLSLGNNFTMRKVGVTELPPLKESRPRDSDRLGKNLRVVCSEFFFMLPSSFILGVVTSLCGIQNSDGPLAVC
jgi:hypothetical protein